MADTIGRREAHKRATREALQHAADTLFGERGVAATTVRDIAEAAGVTERTFFRYFASKEDLLINDAFAWMPALQAAIRNRPAKEAPLLAVRRALQGFMQAITFMNGPSPLALYTDGPPAQRVGISARSVMLKIESDLADVIAERLAMTPLPAGRPRRRPVDTRFEAEVLARMVFALFRGVMLHDLRLREEGATERPDIAQLLDQAFDIVERAQPDPPRPRADRSPR